MRRRPHKAGVRIGRGTFEGRPIVTEKAGIAELCRAAGGGDAAALEALLALHHGRLLGYTLRKIGVEWRGRIDAEDVLQEAYIQAFAHLTDLVCTDEESFHRWIVQIVENRFYDHVRHWKRKKRDVSREIGAAGDSPSAYKRLLEQCHPEGQSPSAVFRRQEARGALMSCIAQLPEDYQIVVRRVFLEQEPYETVGTVLGCSGEAVRRKASRALARLRECLGRASRYLSRLG